MRRRIPLPLVVVLAVVLVEGLAWTFAVPALQGADEGGHFSYVQKIVDAHDIPWTRGEVTDATFLLSVSTEQQVAWIWAGLEPLRGNPAARPLWTRADERVWAAEVERLHPDKAYGWPNTADRNPPLYYLAAAVPYAIVGGTFFDRLFALRLANLPLLLVTVWLTWLLAGEVFGRRRALQTVAAAIVAVQPVLLDVSTRVTPDALLDALGALVLYLVAVLVRRGLSWRRVGALALVVAAALLTHGRGAIFIAPAGLGVLVAGWRAWHPSRARVRLVTSGALAAIAGLALVAYATRESAGHVGGFLSYLWQFYLPALPGMSAPIGPHWGAEQVFLDRFYATFLQFEVTFPADLTRALRDAFWVGLALLAVSAWRHRARLGERRDVVLVLVGALVLEVLALNAAAYRSLLVKPLDPVFTGRYLLPLVPLLGVGVAAALCALPGRSRALASGAVVAGAFLLQLAAFGLVVARFYA